MYPYRLIINLALVIGIISTGCTTGNQNSKESSKEINQINKAGLKQGLWEIYEDSVLISKGSYLAGLPDGLWTSWYKNGQIKEEGNYAKGIKRGMWIEWYEDGGIMWKGEWENGTRKIKHLENRANISFVGEEHEDRLLSVDTTYRLKIRIQNIPTSNLFVEVSSGEITRVEDADMFVLKTSSDTMFTMAIGYIPDLEFRDFRNLISEIDFKLR